MSGPKTAEYRLAEFAVLFADHALGRMRDAKADYEQAIETIRASEAARIERQVARRAATAAHLNEIKANSDSLNRSIARLAALEEETPALPSPPRDSDVSAWSDYIQALKDLLNALEHRVAKNADASVQKALASIEHEQDSNTEISLESILDLYFAQRKARLKAEGKTHNEAKWRTMVARIMARLDLPEGEPLPEHLETLAKTVILAETPERAELLGNELRLQANLHKKDNLTRQQDQEDAERWLSIFTAEDLPAPLFGRLEAVAAGLSPLETAERMELETRETAFTLKRESAKNRAAALILETSLKDLGYQVEGIGETLFEEGGIAHFQRPGWDGYFVRLKTHTKNKTVNFNMVRAENAARDESAVQRREDFMAEERWCTEFPRLMETLAARGLDLKVTRRVGAGDLPVQAVSKDRLPDFSTPETGSRGKPTSRHLDY